MIEETTENLRQQLMINQFTMATGCTAEQARQLLQSTRWEFEMALSVFFQESAISMQNSSFPHPQRQFGFPTQLSHAPANTPATPPSFPDALQALSKLTAGDWASPPTGAALHSNLMAFQQPQFQSPPVSHNFVQPKVLTPCNCPMQTNDRYSSCDFSTTMVSSNMSPFALTVAKSDVAIPCPMEGAPAPAGSGMMNHENTENMAVSPQSGQSQQWMMFSIEAQQ
jgi:hypothetical protein